MSFWIRSYHIKLDRLPYSLMGWSFFVVFLCITLLAGILLLLPIQDKISGDVTIYTSGQPLNLNAPSSGFINFHKKEQEYIKRGDLLASIDVEIDQVAINRMSDFIYSGLSEFDITNTTAYLDEIDVLVENDFRKVNNELYNLADQLKQLEILNGASNPQGVIDNLNRSMNLKVRQLQNFTELNNSEREVLDLLKEQYESDSILLEAGAISKRDINESSRKYLDKKSVLIENELRRQTLTDDIINDEKEKNELLQSYRSKVEELALGIISQVGVIREAFQNYLDEFIIISPVDGYITRPYQIVDEETIQEGEIVMYLSKTQTSTTAKSEMFVGVENAGKIKPGMMVRVGLSEFDQKEFGIYYTKVKAISNLQVDGKYKVVLDCELPLKTSYQIELPLRNSYSGQGEVLLGKINLLTKISREISFNKAKYASL